MEEVSTQRYYGVPHCSPRRVRLAHAMDGRHMASYNNNSPRRTQEQPARSVYPSSPRRRMESRPRFASPRMKGRSVYTKSSTRRTMKTRVTTQPMVKQFSPPRPQLHRTSQKRRHHEEQRIIPTDPRGDSKRPRRDDSTIHRFEAPSACTEMPPPKNRKPKIEDAMEFISQVKTEFSGSSSGRIYKEFLGILKRYKLQEVDTESVVDCVSRLFRGKPALIGGFNMFLPKNARISLDDYGMPEAEGLCPSPMETLAILAAVQPAADENETKAEEEKEASIFESRQVEEEEAKKEEECRQVKQDESFKSDEEEASEEVVVEGFVQDPAPMTVLEEEPARRRPLEELYNYPVDEVSHALNYVEQVQKALHPKDYQAFLNMLQQFHLKRLPMSMIVPHVVRLLPPTLQKGFIYFIPDHLQSDYRRQLRSISRQRK